MPPPSHRQGKSSNFARGSRLVSLCGKRVDAINRMYEGESVGNSFCVSSCMRRVYFVPELFFKNLSGRAREMIEFGESLDSRLCSLVREFLVVRFFIFEGDNSLRVSDF